MITPSNETYKPCLKQMWNHCFPQDSNEFIDFYFDKVYKNDESLVYVENNKPVAFLQMIPYSLKIGAKIYSAAYISGAMTHPDFQKRGYMGQLLKASFEAMKENGYDYTFLIPQEEWLFGFYEKFGYRRFVSPALKVFQDFKSYTEHAQFLATLPNAVLKSGEQFDNIVAVYSADGIELVDCKEKWGMIKKLQPLAETVSHLYMGWMLD
jgi:predicted acetyltransferase